MAGAQPAGQTARMSIAAYLTATGWVDEPVIAAGHLRQGIVRRCRLLPRQFVLAVTQTRVVAFRAWGDGYAIGIKPGIRAAFARHEIELTDLPKGSESTGATMRVRGERFPVSRPKLDGDWDTDELIALLGGLPPLKAPQEPAWAAFSL
jgi:hypothetical protein